MADKINGGPAFPVTFEGGGNNGESPYFDEGMDLRDYFAGQAVAGLFRHSGWTATHDGDEEEIARRSYAVADAMLKARKGEL